VAGELLLAGSAHHFLILEEREATIFLWNLRVSVDLQISVSNHTDIVIGHRCLELHRNQCFIKLKIFYLKLFFLFLNYFNILILKIIFLKNINLVT